jgi:glycerol-3-phosphate acyltransferase PlsY
MTAGYLLGAIPFGLLVAKAGGAGDIRQIGSGNIGTTNVLRTGRKGLAALTLLLDAGKGATAVLVAERFAPGSGILAGAAAFLGHLFPVWLDFKGGKGVATMLGVSLAAVPWAGAAFALVWVTAAALSRYSSLGGMLAAVAAPVAAVMLGEMNKATLLWAMAALVLWMHRENIARLRAGTETKIGQK